MTDPAPAKDVSNLKRIAKYAEGIGKLADTVFTVVDIGNLALDLPDLINGWSAGESPTQATTRQLNEIQQSLSEIENTLISADAMPHLKYLNDLIIGTKELGIEPQLKALSATLNGYTAGKRDSDAKIAFVEWYVGTGERQIVAGRDLASTIIFGREKQSITDGYNPVSMAKIFEPVELGAASDLNSLQVLNDVMEKIRTAQTGSDSAVALDSFFNSRTRYDVFELLYLRLVADYQWAHLLHDSAVGLYSTIIHGDLDRTQLSEKAKAAVKTDSAMDLAAYYAANKWTTVVTGTLLWEDLTGPLADMAGRFDIDSIYAINQNIDQRHRDSAHEIADELWLCYGLSDPPVPDAFISGLRLATDHDPAVVAKTIGIPKTLVESRNYIGIKAHYSRLNANGEVEALGWSTAVAGANSPRQVRIANLNPADLRAAVARHANAEQKDEMLVMTRIGFSESGAAAIFGLTAQYARLQVQPDGSGKILPFEDGVNAQLSTPYSGKNYLNVTGSYLDWVDRTLIGRLDSEGEIVPDGIVTDVLIRRETNGPLSKALYLQAQVTGGWAGLKTNQPGYVPPPAPKPFGYTTPGGGFSVGGIGWGKLPSLPGTIEKKGVFLDKKPK